MVGQRCTGEKVRRGQESRQRSRLQTLHSTRKSGLGSEGGRESAAAAGEGRPCASVKETSAL